MHPVDSIIRTVLIKHNVPEDAIGRRVEEIKRDITPLIRALFAKKVIYLVPCTVLGLPNIYPPALFPNAHPSKEEEQKSIYIENLENLPSAPLECFEKIISGYFKENLTANKRQVFVGGYNGHAYFPEYKIEQENQKVPSLKALSANVCVQNINKTNAKEILESIKDLKFAYADRLEKMCEYFLSFK